MAHAGTYTYSQLSADSVRQLVADHYQFIGPLHCKYYVLGLHDNYLIENLNEKYILRIYRNDWRSPNEANFELELLAFLHERNAQVASPILTASGEWSFHIDSPEGDRIAALFPFAKGKAPGNVISIEQCVLLGRAVSDVHHIADSFKTQYARPELDVHHLVDESIELIAPFIEAEEQFYMASLRQQLRRDWPNIPKDIGIFGICIGDVNATNFHIDDKQHITIFDFDQCGYGFRAFEIGKFISSLNLNSEKSSLKNAFLEGYQEKRLLIPAELEAISYFELVSVIWVMSIHAKNANRIGYKYLEKPFWDKKIAVLKELEGQQYILSGSGNATHAFRG
jgi:Ser/Thr protein kinase RdoA (MazF antagonist)